MKTICFGLEYTMQIEWNIDEKNYSLQMKTICFGLEYTMQI